MLLRSDSRLLIEQLAGRWKVKNPTLQRLHHEARSLIKGFDEVRFEHVRRERNVQADALANRGVDEWLAGEGASWERAPPVPSSVGAGGGTAVTRSCSGNSNRSAFGPLP